MKFEPKDRIVSIERKRNDGIDRMETRVILDYSSFGITKKMELARIIPSRKAGSWNIYFHRYDESLSDVLREDSFEVKSYREESDLRSSLKSLLSDLDSGMFFI